MWDVEGDPDPCVNLSRRETTPVYELHMAQTCVATPSMRRLSSFSEADGFMEVKSLVCREEAKNKRSSIASFVSSLTSLSDPPLSEEDPQEEALSVGSDSLETSNDNVEVSPVETKEKKLKGTHSRSDSNGSTSGSDSGKYELTDPKSASASRRFMKKTKKFLSLRKRKYSPPVIRAAPKSILKGKSATKQRSANVTFSPATLRSNPVEAVSGILRRCSQEVLNHLGPPHTEGEGNNRHHEELLLRFQMMFTLVLGVTCLYRTFDIGGVVTYTYEAAKMVVIDMVYGFISYSSLIAIVLMAICLPHKVLNIM